MQTCVRTSGALASPETDIDQAIEAHAAVIAGLKRLIASSCDVRPGRVMHSFDVERAAWLDPFNGDHVGGCP